ncbi:hypothetical protein MTO96_041389 [Rhipicephalus appendiculatus]
MLFVAAAISLVGFILVTASGGRQCPEYKCPVKNETLLTCQFVCSSSKAPVPWLQERGKWANGTPCWYNDTGNPCVGYCCNGKCEPNGNCENWLTECPTVLS